VLASETQSGQDRPGCEVLTLPEVAAFLRVHEEEVLALAAKDALPAQKVGGEWRFLKQAVVEWLRFGPHFHRDFLAIHPLWMLDHPVWEGLLRVLEKRILSQLSAVEKGSAPPGSKAAVLRHFGVFKDDGDLEEQLAGIRARRQAAGG
jgi:excisionase family DNA binding protein